ncbi:hypothetical protein HOD29_00850 [archaeon]|jgi:transcription factor E|nr:hypothetical protein [archaeon]
MLSKLLKEIVVMTVGKPAEGIAELLETNKHVNEFNIAKKLEITINQTRNILYKVSDYGLVSSIRKKDKKKGWYTYFWKFEILKCLEFLNDILLKRKEELENQIKEREQKHFYICELCNIELSEEEALLQDFTCDECGEVFTTKNDIKLVKELNKNLSKVKLKLVEVAEEMNKELAKLEKVKIKELKKEEKEKAEKRASAAAKRKATREAKAKAAGKLPKKVVAKKKVAKKKAIKKKPGVKKAVKKKLVIKKKIVKKKPASRSASTPGAREPLRGPKARSSGGKKKVSKKKVVKKKVSRKKK